MSFVITLVANGSADLTEARARAIQAVDARGAVVKSQTELGSRALDLIVANDDLTTLRSAVNTALSSMPVDHAVQLEQGRRKRLLIADMDSTIISCECLDELADFAGVKDQVAAITERAMRGEIGFEGALKARVAMLKGLPVTALAACLNERVQLNPGADTLVRTMRQNGARCVLVSGGFASFTGPVARRSGFHQDFSNHLIDDGTVLTGEVAEPILGREAKLSRLLAECDEGGFASDAALAVGDGANDLDMIREAGLGVAYRAKPVVAAEAMARVDHTDLTALLYFQGYREAEFWAKGTP